MVDRSNWDPEMAAFAAAGDEEAKAYPPIRLEIPLEPHRRVNDALSMRPRGWAVSRRDHRPLGRARGRRIYCRVYRPRTDKPLPVLVWFHGGGWVWASVDTHDRLCREYATAADVAVVNVDYALSPEAKFPQAVEECAAVVRHVAEHGADWGLDGSRILLGGDWRAGNCVWRRRCCCVIAAGRRCAASSRIIRCATAGSTRRPTRCSAPAATV